MRELNMNLKDESTENNEIAREIIGAAIQVHRIVGMGLKQESYKKCLILELQDLGFFCEENVEFPLFYKDRLIDDGVRVPLLVEKRILVDVHSIESIREENVLCVLNQLRYAGLGLGLIINFNTKFIKGDAIKRVVNGRPF